MRRLATSRKKTAYYVCHWVMLKGGEEGSPWFENLTLICTHCQVIVCVV